MSVKTLALIFFNFSPVKQAEIRHLASTDPVMKTLSEIIHGGWPENIKDLLVDVRTYGTFHDELSMQNDIILKGNQVIIHDPLRHTILEQLHASHQGIDKKKKLARVCVFGMGCQNQVTTCASYHICQEIQREQTSQPLHPHERPMSPWVKQGWMRYFHIGSNNFLIISDYYSRYPVVKNLPSLSTSATISATKEAFSFLGIPRENMSDKGTQFQRE